jgi:hypothetical protein
MAMMPSATNSISTVKIRPTGVTGKRAEAAPERPQRVRLAASAWSSAVPKGFGSTGRTMKR